MPRGQGASSQAGSALQDTTVQTLGGIEMLTALSGNATVAQDDWGNTFSLAH